MISKTQAQKQSQKQARDAFNKHLKTVVKELKGGTDRGFYQESKASLNEILLLNEKHKFLTFNSQQGISRRGTYPLNRKRYAKIFEDVDRTFTDSFAKKEREFAQKIQAAKTADEKAHLIKMRDCERDKGQEFARFGNYSETMKMYMEKGLPVRKNQIIYDERAFISGYMENDRAKILCDILNAQSNVVAWATAHGEDVDEYGDFVVPPEYVVKIPVNADIALGDGSYSVIPSKPLIERLKLSNKPYLSYDDLDSSHPFYRYYSFVNIVDTRWGYNVKHKDGLFQKILDAMKEVK